MINASPWMTECMSDILSSAQIALIAVDSPLRKTELDWQVSRSTKSLDRDPFTVSLAKGNRLPIHASIDPSAAG